MVAGMRWREREQQHSDGPSTLPNARPRRPEHNIPMQRYTRGRKFLTVPEASVIAEAVLWLRGRSRTAL